VRLVAQKAIAWMRTGTSWSQNVVVVQIDDVQGRVDGVDHRIGGYGRSRTG
jgi:hypothetical protein